MTNHVTDCRDVFTNAPFAKLLEQKGGKGKEHLAEYLAIFVTLHGESDDYRPRLPITLSIHDSSVACDGVGPYCDAMAFMQPGTARKLAKLLTLAADVWEKKEK